MNVQQQELYPKRAGAKERGSTSEAAADAIEGEGRAQRLRDRVWRLFEDGMQLSADAAAGVLQESILAIRPRVSELRARGLIEATGRKECSHGGRLSMIWKKTRSMNFEIERLQIRATKDAATVKAINAYLDHCEKINKTDPQPRIRGADYDRLHEMAEKIDAKAAQLTLRGVLILRGA